MDCIRGNDHIERGVYGPGDGPVFRLRDDHRDLDAGPDEVGHGDDCDRQQLFADHFDHGLVLAEFDLLRRWILLHGGRYRDGVV